VDGVRGLDSQRVPQWISAHVGAVAAPFEFELIAGGRSNLTFAVTDAEGRRFVLRRPPLGHVLETAHDMGREFRILSALRGTGVPVPEPLAFCADPDVNGAPFYLMEFADGAILRDADEAERGFAEPDRGRLADALVRTLGDLHAIDPDAVGLGTLGRPDGYVERQLRRWQRQWELARSREIPAIDEVHRRLSERIPEPQRRSIVHGDYRIDNMVFRPDGTVRAVLDWELCTLGDPLADVGLLAVYWARPGDDAVSLLLAQAPSRAPGFPERAELLDAYARHTGADLSEIDFYIALGYWKLACIAEGVYARYRAGVMGDDGMDPARLGEQVFQLAEAALATLTASSSTG
jgi:aminoglycoside phosphotransferase (APT) family kinase protein